MRRMLRQSKRLPRYSCSSLLAGQWDRQGRMDSSSISTPQSWWNLAWAGREWERMTASRSLLTNLLSSMTLCLILKLGMMRLARQSSILVSPTRVSIDVSHSSIIISVILRILRAISYSSTLSSSCIFSSVSVRLSNSPFYISQMHMRQNTSQTWSLVGSSDTISCRNYMHCMLMSELGWLRILRTGCRMFDCTTRGMCSCPISCSFCSRLSIDSSDWQNFIGSVGYFIRRLMFCSQRSPSSSCHRISCQRVISSSGSPWGGTSSVFMTTIINWINSHEFHHSDGREEGEEGGQQEHLRLQRHPARQPGERHDPGPREKPPIIA